MHRILSTPGFLLVAIFGFLQLACIFLHTIVCPKRGFLNFLVWGESLDTAATDVPVILWRVGGIGCTYPEYQVAMATKLANIWWCLIFVDPQLGLSSYHPSGAWVYQVSPRYLDNFFTHAWNDNWQGNPDYACSQRDLFQFDFIRRKSHMDCPGVEPGPPLLKARPVKKLAIGVQFSCINPPPPLPSVQKEQRSATSDIGVQRTTRVT